MLGGNLPSLPLLVAGVRRPNSVAGLRVNDKHFESGCYTVHKLQDIYYLVTDFSLHLFFKIINSIYMFVYGGLRLTSLIK